MRKLIKMYTPFINAGIQETIAYRVDVFFYLLGEVFTALVSYFIWKAVFEPLHRGGLHLLRGQAPGGAEPEAHGHHRGGQAGIRAEAL